MKPSVSVALAAAVSLALAATGASAQVVAASDAIPTPQTPWFVPDAPTSEATATPAPAPTQGPACAPMASIRVRGSIGRDGSWHEAASPSEPPPSARGGGPCDTAARTGDRGPTPQEPLGDGAPAPIVAPPPPAIGHAMLGVAPTPRRVVYTYRDRLHPVDRSSSASRR